jgi:hypothetical protein
MPQADGPSSARLLPDMSLRVRASCAAAVLVALYLCGAGPLASTHPAAASGETDALTVTAYGDLGAAGDPASRGEEADPEDAEPLSEGRDLLPVASYAGHPISIERSRSGRQDRPPRRAHLG